MRNRTVRIGSLRVLVAINTIGVCACAPDDGAAPSGDVPGYVLDEPEVVSGEFGSVNGIRVRADGSLLVADRISGELVLADLDAGTREVVGSRGEGPGEYQTPSGLWPLPGDSTLLLDFGNNRLTVLSPDLSFGVTRPMLEMDPEGGIRLLTPQAIDGAGRIYTRQQSISTNISAMRGGSGAASDSTEILRTALSDLTTDTVARLTPRPQARVEMRSGADNMMMMMRRTPYSPSDSWGVEPDGSVVVARASDYHLEKIGPDGSVRSGAPVDHDPVPVGQAEKEEWVAGVSSPSVGTSIQLVRGPGSVSSGISSGGSRNLTMGAGSEDVDDYDWPENLPAFTGSILVDPEGRAWLRRHQPAGAPHLYDIFTPDAEHTGTVEIANGHSVIGFGNGVVYATFKNEVDLVYIERYRLPGR